MTISSPGLYSSALNFKASIDNPLHWLSQDLRNVFGGPVRKIALDSGATCPNRDGTKGRGGCSFCEPGGSGPDDAVEGELWETRLKLRADDLMARGAAGAMAYFQAYSATYGRSACELKELIDKAMSVDGVTGVVLATRPDCLGSEILDTLAEAARRCILWVEIGMQTCNDRTLEALNRGHGHSATIEAVGELKKRNILCVLHVVLGLPGEGPSDAEATFREVARLSTWGLKVHPLLILEGSRLADGWRAGKVSTLSMYEYVDMVVSGMELIPESMTIHRLTGERPGNLMLAPSWCAEKGRVLNSIMSEIAKRRSYQGRWIARKQAFVG